MLASPHKFPYINQHFHTETSFIYYRNSVTLPLKKMNKKTHCKSIEFSKEHELNGSIHIFIDV